MDESLGALPPETSAVLLMIPQTQALNYFLENKIICSAQHDLKGYCILFYWQFKEKNLFCFCMNV